MKRQTILLIALWSGIIGIWANANPPNQKISADSAGNIGIATSTPMTALDVNGTTTIRKSLDMTESRITNVGTPTLGTDGVPLNYISATITAISSSTTRLWGEGRPGAIVLNTAGQCTSTVNGRTIKISKSKFAASWDRSPAACPANWWVCTAAERDINGSATAGYGKCPASGAIISPIVGCQRSDGNPLKDDNLYVPTADASGVPYDVVWVADAGAAAHVGKAAGATVVGAVANEIKDDLICIVAPVWCCSY